MTALALWAIRFYQRVISPRKGFRCAYAAYTGNASCSALGYRAIRRHGLAGGITLLNRRLHKCGVAHERYRPAMGALLARQAGFCDLDCGIVDLADLACNGPANCACDLPCDFGRRRRRNEIDDRDFKLPPRRSA